jgi:hypothetical protein
MNPKEGKKFYSPKVDFRLTEFYEGRMEGPSEIGREEIPKITQMSDAFFVVRA